MSNEAASERLEDRLERLARLHHDGQLDDDEYRAAKAQLLAPPSLQPSPPAGARSSGPRPLGPLRWRSWFIIAWVAAFMVACLASAFTSLQEPGGAVLCRGRFVAGNVSETFGGTTAFNMDSVCLGVDGSVRHVNQLALIGVLWVEYTVVGFAAVVVLVSAYRALRPDHPGRKRLFSVA